MICFERCFSSAHVSAGLLLLRPYAVTDHKRLTLAILIPFGLAALGSELVSKKCLSYSV